MMIRDKGLEIFCGTGGVGKTTLATSRAFDLAQKNKKILLMTVDPSLRLKQVLGLDQDNAGKIETVTLQPNHSQLSVDVLLVNPEVTLKNCFAEVRKNRSIPNRILKILSKPHGGLNEILALVELQKQINSKAYDSIILDTPPSKHFLDFLNSGQQIHLFFNKTYIDIFQFLGKTVTGTIKKVSPGILKKIMHSGIEKLLEQLEKVTGKMFVNDFIDAVLNIYELKELFLEASMLPAELKNNKLANWFLVTSVEQKKMLEAQMLKTQLQEFTDDEIFFLINKSIQSGLVSWRPQDERLVKFKSFMINKEKHVLDQSKNLFKKIVLFPEILEPAPLEHVIQTLPFWHISEQK